MPVVLGNRCHFGYITTLHAFGPIVRMIAFAVDWIIGIPYSERFVSSPALGAPPILCWNWVFNVFGVTKHVLLLLALLGRGGGGLALAREPVIVGADQDIPSHRWAPVIDLDYRLHHDGPELD